MRCPGCSGPFSSAAVAGGCEPPCDGPAVQARHGSRSGAGAVLSQQGLLGARLLRCPITPIARPRSVPAAAVPSSGVASGKLSGRRFVTAPIAAGIRPVGGPGRLPRVPFRRLRNQQAPAVVRPMCAWIGPVATAPAHPTRLPPARRNGLSASSWDGTVRRQGRRPGRQRWPQSGRLRERARGSAAIRIRLRLSSGTPEGVQVWGWLGRSSPAGRAVSISRIQPPSEGGSAKCIAL